MIRVFTIIDYYLPGFKAGGPQRTLHYQVENLGDEFDFRILTSDRDLGDTAPYPGVELNRWIRSGKSHVFYTSVADLGLSRMRRMLNEAEYDVLYLNSLFSPGFTIKPLLLRRLGWLRDVPVIVQPRGELNKGAVAIKSRKKLGYLALTKALGFYRGVIWHASNEYEVEDIHRHFGTRARTIVANLPARLTGAPPERDKEPGRLAIAFLSRISPKKNLSAALRLLDGLRGQVEMNVYGPVEDAAYWAQCQEIAAKLPPNIAVRHHGPVRPDRVGEVFGSSHLFLFPTLGENFGHVIFEALAAGCPVLLSDQTPWRRLREQGCGWDIPLARPEEFRKALQECVDMDSAGFHALSQNAFACAAGYIRNSGALEQTRQLFHAAASTARVP